MEEWKDEIMEQWGNGKMGCWIHQYSNIPIFQFLYFNITMYNIKKQKNIK